MQTRPGIDVAVVLERDAQPGSPPVWHFRIVDVVPQEDGFGTEAQRLEGDDRLSRWLHPGWRLELVPEEGQGYHRNLSSGAPVWFVRWCIDASDASLARPEALSLSCDEAGRWRQVGERVDTVPLPPYAQEWLRGYTELHYRPEPVRRRRPETFSLPDRRG